MTTSSSEHRFIDVHRHATPGPMLAAAQRLPGWQMPNVAGFLMGWTPEGTIEDMDKNDIATSVMSIVPAFSYPGLWLAQTERRQLSRLQNEYLAGMIRDFPGRFGMFASLPLPDVEGSLKEIEYAIDTLGTDGFTLATNHEGRYPSDPAFVPVLEELNRRKAVVFVHPHIPLGCTELVPHVNRMVIEAPVDTTRAIANLVYTGTLVRFPDIRYIFCHGGGVTTSIFQRLDRAAGGKTVHQHYPNGLKAELGKMWFDILNMTNDITAPSLRNMIGCDRLLFGSDHPAVASEVTVSGWPELGLDPAETRMMARDNALALMPRLGR